MRETQVRKPPHLCVTVVIPAFNVSRHIGQVIAGLPSWIDHVIVVDDCSTDNTAAVALASAHPKVQLLRREKNGGVGAASKTGFREALRVGADVVVKMDGDDQMDPAQLARLVAPLIQGQADYTKGNRFRNTTALRAMPFWRRLGNIVLSFLAKLASGYWDVFDPTNGYTAIRREALSALRFDHVADRYFFEMSMLVELNLVNACVRDVYMPSRYGDENSSLRISKVLVSFPLKLFTAALARIRDKYFVYDFTPVSLFIVASLPLLAIGFFLGVKYWHHSIVTGIPTTAGQVMLAVLPLLLGFQLLLQAFVIDISAVPRVSSFGVPGHARPEQPEKGILELAAGIQDTSSEASSEPRAHLT